MYLKKKEEQRRLARSTVCLHYLSISLSYFFSWVGCMLSVVWPKKQKSKKEEQRFVKSIKKFKKEEQEKLF